MGKIRNFSKQISFYWREYRSSKKNCSFVDVLSTLDAFHSKHPNGILLFGFWLGLGDLTFEFAFLDEMRKWGELFVLLPEGKAWLAKSYGDSPEVITISNDMAKLLQNPFLARYICKRRKRFGHAVYACINSRYYQVLKADFRVRFPLLSAYRKHLGFTNEVKPKPFPIDQALVKPLAERKRRVIFNLDSKSLWLSDNEAMLALYQACRKRGYSVIFNRRGLPGTNDEIFDGSISEFLSLCLDSVALVSIRSGIMDLALATGIKMLAVYPNSPTSLHAFSFKQWGDHAHLVREATESNALIQSKQLIGDFLNGRAAKDLPSENKDSH